MERLKRSLTWGWALLLTMLSSVCLAPAQRVKATGERHIINRVRVIYPPIALQMRLQGTVKILATVAPSGKVVKTELIGGSPVFVPYAMDAVSLMNWETAPKQTQEMVEIEFSPREGK
ncbi:MAG TPA: energy transducer TonB [Candidatus Sulfotelmatobacter sp.]|nr:energy transducer TonB [Candidatus Sulfotelmatobacter sp.]